MKQAIILAAGEGNRLRPFTAEKPKGMLSIADKPILQYVIEALAQNGIRNIVLVVGYRREQIFDYMGSGERFGVEISYVTQPNQLGTAHALLQARKVAGDEFLVLSGDKLIEASTIARFVSVAPGAMLLKQVDNPSRHGMVTVEGGVVKGITESPKETEGNLATTRIYALSKEIFDFIGTKLVISDVLNSMIAQGRTLHAYETDGIWLDVIYPWDILSLNGAVLGQIKAEVGGTTERGVFLKGEVSIGKDTVIRSNSSIVGPVIIGSGCDIGPNVCILPSTSIGDNVVIAPLSEIKNSVVGSDTAIGPGSIIEDSVIDKGCVIGGQFTASSGEAEVEIKRVRYTVKVGAMLGSGCNLGSGVVAQPGVVVGNYSQVLALKLIAGRLPDGSLVV